MAFIFVLGVALAITVMAVAVIGFAFVALRDEIADRLEIQEEMEREAYRQAMLDLNDDMEVLVEQELFGGLSDDALIYNVQKRILVINQMLYHIERRYHILTISEAIHKHPLYGLLAS